MGFREYNSGKIGEVAGEVDEFRSLTVSREALRTLRSQQVSEAPRDLEAT